MASPRFNRLSSERQAAILTAAGQAFAEHGFEGASLNRIIADCGLSKGTFYYYFTDKADLFGRVAEYIEQQAMAGLHDPALFDRLTAENYWEQLDEMVTGNHFALQTHPWIAGFAKAIYQLPREQFDATLRDRFAAQAVWFETVLARGQELGVIRTDLPANALSAIALGAGEAFDRWALNAATAEELLADIGELSALGLDLMRRLLGAPNFIQQPRPEEESS